MAGSRAAMASIAAHFNIVIFLRLAGNITEQIEIPINSVSLLIIAR